MMYRTSIPNYLILNVKDIDLSLINVNRTNLCIVIVTRTLTLLT